jgi:surfeit locus 1 family protein
VTGRARFMLLGGASLAALVLTLSLGLWQLSRAGQKLALQASMQQAQQLPLLGHDSLFGVPDPQSLLHRRVALQGRWQASGTVYLENRQMNAKPGFFVVTPLKPEPAGPLVLVLRGWAPRDFQNRAALPPVSTPEGLVEVQGMMAAPPSKLYEFGGPGQGPIRQNLDMVRYSAELGQPLFALTLRQQGRPSEGLLRQWPPIDLGVEKHQGYALQWFVLAALVAGLFIWFQIVRPLRSRHAKQP